MNVLILAALIAIRIRIVKALEWFFCDDFELTLGYWCETCSDVHETNSRCLREMVGVCLDCGKDGIGSLTKLDRFGNCAKCRGGQIRDRKLRWERA